MNDRGINIKALPGEERPRERLFRYGAEHLSNRELIAIIIGSGNSDGSALEIAERLMSMDDEGIGYFAVCQPEEFCRVKGVGVARAAQLSATVELGKRIFSRGPESRRKVSCSDDVAMMVMQEMRYLKKEVFRIMMLNVKNEVIATEDISVGGLSSAPVHPREVFTNAIKRGANSIVLIHNHPSGNPEPSRSDILLTERLEEAGKLIGIGIVDHIVIGNGTYVSIMSMEDNRSSGN